MWANCDVGATSPEGEGTKYAWGEESWDTIPLESDPVYMNSDMEWKEVLRPRTPSPTQVQELLDNTTATEEVLNGVAGVRYTASNGNSIFISDVFRWTSAFKYTVNNWSRYEAVCWNPSLGIIDNTATYNTISYMKSEYTMKEYHYPFRGVCNYLPQGNAFLLEYGKQITVSANDANALYCFPKNWTSTEFVATSNHSVEMYVSNQADFSFDGTNVLTTCSFDTEGSEKVLYLSTKEIADFAAQASDDYIYVRFKSATTISIMPNAWDALACLDYSVQIDANVEEYIPNNTNAVIYRFRYDDFSGYDMTIKWNGNGILPVYLSDTCSFELSANDPHVLLYKNIARRGSHVVSAATLEEWASRVGKEGYLYARFNPLVSSRVTFQTDKLP